MEFFETVAKRYSHRTPFLDQPVPDADVRKIVEAGIQAPSGQNCQTTSFVVEDYAASVENMLLAATALGYATVWMDGMTKAPAACAAIASLLHVPEGKTVRPILPLGVPAEVGEPKPRKSFEERAHYNQF